MSGDAQMEADALLLSRAQFAFTIAFHILFPSLTIGLAWFLVFCEAAWLRTRQDAWFRLYRFWAKIFALAFGIGVVTGIVISFQFGTNWSGLSYAAGEVLGPLLGYEVLTAFFLEAGFLGIMLFGWQRVPPRVHFAATCLVAVGTVISAFWILSANSWMQTPVGHVMVDGKAVPEDWWTIIFNPSFPYRFVHMVIATFLSSAMVVAGVSAWQLIKGLHAPFARRGFAMAMSMVAVLAPVQIVAGDLHGLNTLEHQPIKIAGMEALWESGRGADLLLFAWPDEAAERNRFELAIPRGAAFILTHDPDGELQGLKSVPPEDRPPVPYIFWAFRIMVACGLAMLGVGLIAMWLRWRQSLYRSTWFHWLAVLASPLGMVAILAGWTVTEVGRQPWLVQGIFRTADMVSPSLTGGQVWSSFAPFLIIYHLLLVAFLYYLVRVIHAGPDYAEPLPGQARPLPGIGGLTSWLPEPGARTRSTDE